MGHARRLRGRALPATELCLAARLRLAAELRSAPALGRALEWRPTAALRWGRSLRLAAALALACGLALVSGVARAATADRFAAIEQQAAAASDAAAVERVADRFQEQVKGLGAGSPPAALQAAAETFGALVSRARETGAGGGLFSSLTGVGSTLERRGAEIRERLEAAAGEDEAALEALYRSDDWRRLDYAGVVVGYWSAWAQLARAESLQPGAERQAALEKAQRGFSRASIELALPRLATLSLLGLGIVRRELGDRAGAREALERFEEQAQRAGHEKLLAPARYELALLAFEEGDLERGRRLTSRIPDGALARDQELALVRLEAEAWLERAESGGAGAAGRDAAGDTAQEGPGDGGAKDGARADAAGDSAAARAAALLRRLREAGGDAARSATALVLEHRDVLAGQDVGPASDLVAAEQAFAAGHYAQARDAYARALDGAAELEGLNLDAARYKYAVSVSKAGGDRERALAALGDVLQGGGSGLSGPAVRLYYTLATEAAREDSSAKREARARRAAELLLELDPDAPQADHARYRLAESAGTREALRLLEDVSESSSAYPAARLELARRRADALQSQTEGSGPLPRSLRPRAEELLDDIEEVGLLAREGKLPPDPERDATLAVLRARAAAWAGDPPQRVLVQIQRAEGKPRLGPEERRALLRLRLQTWIRAGRYPEVAQRLSQTPESEVRRDWAIWREAVSQLEARRGPEPSDALLARVYERLAAAAPEELRDETELKHAEALLGAGHAQEAADAAKGLVERDPTWGDAYWTYARALEAAGDTEAAVAAWRQVSRGVEPGTRRWVEARIAFARTARRAGRRSDACRAVSEVRRQAPDLAGAPLHEALAAAAEGCPDLPTSRR